MFSILSKTLDKLKIIKNESAKKYNGIVQNYSKLYHTAIKNLSLAAFFIKKSDINLF